VNSSQRLFFDPKQGRGPSDFDVRHNFIFNYIWELPGPHSGPSALQWVAGGWQWGGILHLSTGEPFTPKIGGDPLGMANFDAYDRPDVVTGSGCDGSLVNSGDPIHYIKTNCFVFPTPRTRMGNAARNILPGPGLQNFDTSLFKNFKITESKSVDFRAQVYNLANTASFSTPATAVNLATGGQVTSTRNLPRVFEFGLKFSF